MNALRPSCLLLLLFAAACGAGSAPGPVDAGDPTEAALLRLYAPLSPAPFPGPPQDPTNRWADDPRAAALGRALFFDPGFSGRLLDPENAGPDAGYLGTVGEPGRVSCAGCHQPEHLFADGRSPPFHQLTIGSGWLLRKTPSLLDVAQARLLMWDGRRDALYNQVFGPLESPLEMNSSRLFVAEEIFRRYRAPYEAIFGPLPELGPDGPFPQLDAARTGCSASPAVDAPTLHPSCDGERHGLPGDGAEYDGLTPAQQEAVTRVVVNMGKALGAYERKLACGPGPFDAWIRGQSDALSPSAKRGAALFADKGRCLGCHGGPFFSDQRFHNVGLAPLPVVRTFVDRGDRGAAEGLALLLADPLNSRGPFSDGASPALPDTPGAGLEGAFRTPTLRCASRRSAFLHTGQAATLYDAVDFFDRGGDPAQGGLAYPGTNELTAIGFTPSERIDLVAFLKALDGPGPASEWLSPTGGH